MFALNAFASIAYMQTANQGECKHVSYGARFSVFPLLAACGVERKP